MAKKSKTKKQAKNTKTQAKQIEPTNSPKIAPLVLRFKSFAVDSFMLTTPIVYFVVYIVIGGGEAFATQRAFGWSIILAIHTIVILSFWILKQQSPGMKAYNLKLVNANQDKPINILQYIIRYILTIISATTIMAIFPFFTQQKRTIQDILSQTIIIEEN